MNPFRVFLILVVMLTAGWTGPAAAEIRVTFYSHGWGVGVHGETYFPHAFIRVEGTPAGGAPVDETYGFTANDLTTAVRNLPGFVKPADPRYIGDSQPHFWLLISDETYGLMMARIAWWRTPEGSLYNLRSRNCIDFVADMASTLGLEPGQTRTWKPNLFMADTMKRNLERVIVPASPMATPAPAPVAAESPVAANP